MGKYVLALKPFDKKTLPFIGLKSDLPKDTYQNIKEFNSFEDAELYFIKMSSGFETDYLTVNSFSAA